MSVCLRQLEGSSAALGPASTWSLLSCVCLCEDRSSVTGSTARCCSTDHRCSPKSAYHGDTAWHVTLAASTSPHSVQSRPDGIWLCSWSGTRLLWWCPCASSHCGSSCSTTICRSWWHGRPAFVHSSFRSAQLLLIRTIWVEWPSVWT